MLAYAFPRPLGLGPLKFLMITIGFLAQLVLGNVYACNKPAQFSNVLGKNSSKIVPVMVMYS